MITSGTWLFPAAVIVFVRLNCMRCFHFLQSSEYSFRVSNPTLKLSRCKLPASCCGSCPRPGLAETFLQQQWWEITEEHPVLPWFCHISNLSQQHTWASTMSPLSPGRDVGSLPWDVLPSALLTQHNLFTNLAGHAGIWRLVYMKWFRTTSGFKFPLFTNLPQSQRLRKIIP